MLTCACWPGLCSEQSQNNTIALVGDYTSRAAWPVQCLKAGLRAWAPPPPDRVPRDAAGSAGLVLLLHCCLGGRARPPLPTERRRERLKQLCWERSRRSGMLCHSNAEPREPVSRARQQSAMHDPLAAFSCSRRQPKASKEGLKMTAWKAGPDAVLSAAFVVLSTGRVSTIAHIPPTKSWWAGRIMLMSFVVSNGLTWRGGGRF